MEDEKVYNDFELLFMESFSEFVTMAYTEGELTFSQIKDLSIKVINDIQQCQTMIEAGVIKL